MKLYHVPGSNNCRRVLAVAKHLDITFEEVTPNISAGDLREPEYLAINPNAKVPALVDGDLRLWESTAIMHYLAAKKPEGGLVPSDPVGLADVIRWQAWDLAHFGQATGTLSFENLVKPRFLDQQPDPAAVERGLAEFRQFAPVVNHHLEGRKFLLGDPLTLADFSLGGSMMYAEMAGAPVADYPHLVAWYQRLEAVPAWKETAPRF